MLRRRKQAEPAPSPQAVPIPPVIKNAVQAASPQVNINAPQIPVWDEAAIEKVANALLGEIVTVLAEAPITVHVAVAARLAITIAAHLAETGQPAMAIDMLSGLIETADDARQAIIEATRGT